MRSVGLALRVFVEKFNQAILKETKEKLRFQINFVTIYWFLTGFYWETIPIKIR